MAFPLALNGFGSITLKTIIFFITAMAIATFSHAAFLDNGDFSTDTQSRLDWLDVTETLGLSYNQVQAQFTSGGSLDGWRYATGDEFDQLLINFGFTPEVCSNGTQFCSFSGDFQSVTPPFIVQLGDTSGGDFPVTPTNEFFGWTRGIIGDSRPEFDSTWLAIVDWDGLNTHHFSLANDNGDPNSGSFLVRESSIVPIPAASWLFITSLLGIALAKRQRIMSSSC